MPEASRILNVGATRPALLFAKRNHRAAYLDLLMREANPRILLDLDLRYSES
jgi:hypothetical protein